MHVKEQEFRDLLKAMGYEKRSEQPARQLEKSLEDFTDLAAQEEAEEPHGNAKKLSDRIFAALEEGEELVLVTRPGAEALHRDLERIAARDATEPEPPVKRPRGRPKGTGKANGPGTPRAKKERDKSVPEMREPSFTLTGGFPKKEKITRHLAERFRDMKPVPHDRPLSAARLQKAKEAFARQEFHGATWASVHVKETDEILRVNGKHTSIAACDFFDAGQKLDAAVSVAEFECETLEQAAALYASFDSRDAARNKGDILATYTGVDDRLEGLTKRQLSVITAGIAFGQWEKTYKAHPTTDQGELLVANAEFAQWAGKLLTGSNPKEKFDHVMRMSVVAAMYKTWKVDKKDAAIFWEMTRDDCDGEVGFPPRRLHKWLLTKSIRSGTKKDRVSDLEVLGNCLLAWNAWREEQDSVELKFSEKHKIPQAA